MFNRFAPISKTAAVRICGVAMMVVAASVVLLTTSAAQARTQAQTQAQDARVRQGAAAAAPAGFLDYCRRVPDQCHDADVPASAQEDARIRARANSLFWNAAFAASATDLGVQQADRVVDAQGEQALSARRQATIATATAPETADGAAFSIDDALVDAVERRAEPAVLNKARWDAVETVNRAVNRKIRRASDLNAHGQADYWDEVKTGGAPGDCEDYVLTKRHALIDAGVPAAALSIAIVQTTWNETHAVLIVSGDDGDYVLDNLSPWVKRWNETGYRFVERQTPGRPLEWVSAR